ncbi:MAG: hypothetical protein JO081_07005, partial [Alphaproteobacteria bacterium]|nr:hypothetical protein [Alphaproteobacteria bacterium]
MDRQPVRVIVYAWGKPYVDRLLNHAVASLLAPGNLPALVEFFDCTLVVVTEEKLFKYVEVHPLMQRAKALCAVRLVALDDVIGEPWQYGISLAHALFRGFSDLGEAMTDTYLLFLNADFVLADGCYERLIPHMKRGESVLLSPSYCVVEEEVEPLLEEIGAEGDGVLAIPPRQMARMIIDHRHNTIRAKTISQQSIHFEYMDQAYWQVDEDTIIGHQMPICMVAMRPETVLAEINTFWDWGITYEFCPSRELTVLGDSDEFLILELRNEAKHRDLVRLGPATPNAAAARMSGYLTQYQLDNARFPLTLHAGALPPGIDTGRTELRAFFDEVLRQQPAHVPDHCNHPQWIYHRWHLSRHIAASRLRSRIAALRAESAKDRAKARRKQNGALMMLAATLAPRFAEIRDRAGKNDADRQLAASAIRKRDETDRALAAIAHEFDCEAEVLERVFQEDADRSAAPRREESEALRRELRTIEEAWALTWDDLGYCGAPVAEPAGGGAVISRGLRRRLFELVKRSYEWTYGSVPHTRPWHPLHFICKDIARLLDDASVAGLRLLLVSPQHSIATRWVDPARRRHLRVSPAALLNGALDGFAASVQFDFCFVELDGETFARIGKIWHILADRIAPGGDLLICWINSTCEANERLQPAFGECALLANAGARLRFFSSASGWGALRAVHDVQEKSHLSRWARLAALLRRFLQVGVQRPVEGPSPLQ